MPAGAQGIRAGKTYCNSRRAAVNIQPKSSRKRERRIRRSEPQKELPILLLKSLLVDPASSELFLVRAADSLRVPLVGAIRIKDRPELLSEDNIEELSPHWHFDPWWLLRDSRYEDNEWTDILRATNSAGKFQGPISSLLYSGNLQRVRWVVMKTKEGDQAKGFSSSMLPEYNPMSQREVFTSRPGWRLAPFWGSGSRKFRDPD